MALEGSKNENPLLNRSPLAAKIEGLETTRLERKIQERLGCVINDDVFLESPYAFVPRQALLELSQGSNAPLEHLGAKITAYSTDDVLIGYAAKSIEADQSGEFVICLTEEISQALISYNRTITKDLRKRIEGEINKTPQPWQDHGSSSEMENFFLRPTRPTQEIVVTLPISELCRRKLLTDRSPNHIRDGYVELVTIYEEFEIVRFTTITDECQTNLESKDEAAQTYPGRPKNQTTQYEFEISDEFLEIWRCEEQEEKEEVEESEKEHISGSNAQSSSKSEEEIEINEEELKRQEKKLKEWEKLSIFLKNYVEEMNDAISFNASTNLYVNDVAELDKDEGTFVFTEVRRACKERVSLIDLKTIGDKYLLSASWHCEANDVIVCAYLNKEAKSSSLIALWSLHSPLQPKVILNCREKISTISFCPLRNYTNIIIGGCLDGKIVVWETVQQWLENAEDLFEKKGILEGPLIKEAKIAESAVEAQTLSITSIQWFPSWCRLEPDGNFQKNTAADVKAYFATSSADGSIFFWSLPRSLATPAKVRSPLHLTISPIYQLMIEENAEKSSQRISVTCFCLPLAKNEESSSMSIRDQSDLERLRKIFLGTDSGEVLCCTWEGQTFSVEVTDKEVCKTLSRSSVHDGLVKTMAKSPHLDDVFLTVGGRVFAIWKEDFPEAPVFRRRCKKDFVYGEGCWSGRSGIFVLTRLDGCFEIWDLKQKADKPIQLQTLSDKITPSIWASPATHRKPQLALLNGQSTLHIFLEPGEERMDEDLERLEWFEEFVWRETKRKFDFYRWQSEYLKENPMALRRKSEREQAEAARKHQEAREKFLKEQEKLAREEEQRKLAKRQVCKSELWRQNEIKRAETVLLKQKGFVPSELEEKRKPLVLLAEQRKSNSRKIKKDLERADEILKKSLAREIPEARCLTEKVVQKVAKGEENLDKMRAENEEEYLKLREELSNRIQQQPVEPQFAWSKARNARIKGMFTSRKQRGT